MAEQKPKTIKVNVSLTVEVDLDSWRLAYGDQTVSQIRNDVRYSLLSAVSSSGGVFAPDAGVVGVELAAGQR